MCGAVCPSDFELSYTEPVGWPSVEAFGWSSQGISVGGEGSPDPTGAGRQDAATLWLKAAESFVRILVANTRGIIPGSRLTSLRLKAI